MKWAIRIFAALVVGICTVGFSIWAVSCLTTGTIPEIPLRQTTTAMSQAEQEEFLKLSFETVKGGFIRITTPAINDDEFQILVPEEWSIRDAEDGRCVLFELRNAKRAEAIALRRNREKKWIAESMGDLNYYAESTARNLRLSKTGEPIKDRLLRELAPPHSRK